MSGILLYTDPILIVILIQLISSLMIISHIIILKFIVNNIIHSTLVNPIAFLFLFTMLGFITLPLFSHSA